MFHNLVYCDEVDQRFGLVRNKPRRRPTVSMTSDDGYGHFMNFNWSSTNSSLSSSNSSLTSIDSIKSVEKNVQELTQSSSKCAIDATKNGDTADDKTDEKKEESCNTSLSSFTTIDEVSTSPEDYDGDNEMKNDTD